MIPRGIGSVTQCAFRQFRPIQDGSNARSMHLFSTNPFHQLPKSAEFPMLPYDPDNVFAKIIAGEIPSHRVHEDDHTIAFMDVMPQSEGHTLVVPKQGSRNLLDADPDVLSHVIRTTQAVAKAVRVAMRADGIQIVQYNEPAGGQTVFHLHFHVIPRYDGAPLKPHTGQMADSDQLAEHAARIRAAIA